MVIKRVLCPARVRKTPKQFSWVDQRLIQEHYIERCDAQALALYLFLLTAADAQGLSFYADTTLVKRLSMDPARLAKAREELRQAGLIVYEKPLYQVFALGPLYPISNPKERRGQLRAVREWLAESLPQRP
ncbi:MAG: hypothetical protein ACREYC_17445 [Gammaproteobacteria bacterium]